jgi:hypothetical protein
MPNANESMFMARSRLKGIEGTLLDKKGYVMVGVTNKIK